MARSHFFPEWAPARLAGGLWGVRQAAHGAFARFGALSLVRQFLAATSLVLVAGMIILGQWVSAQIETGVVRNFATATAVYLDNFIEPHVRELATGSEISTGHQEALTELLRPSLLGNRIVNFHVWDTTGRIVYSTQPQSIGTRVEDDQPLLRAISGHVDGAYWPQGHDDVGLRQGPPRPILEIYAPIRDGPGGRVIAVAEFYEDGAALARDLQATRVKTWGMVAAIALAMLALQFGIVHRGGRTIEGQRTELARRVAVLTDLLAQNVDLRRKVDAARRSSHLHNERFMRRLGAELHDGPAQLVGMASVMLEPLDGETADTALDEISYSRHHIAVVREALSDALSEIRHLSAGLILPAVDALSPRAALELIVKAHERRTRTQVRLELTDMPTELSPLVKVTLCRLAQEGLNNAFHHADGAGQVVRATGSKIDLRIEVLDEGPGPGVIASDPKRPDHLGLLGLKDRVEALGGSLRLQRRETGGSCLSAHLPLDQSEHQDDRQDPSCDR